MADCDFAGRETYHLALRLVCGCHNKDTQRKLLALPTVDLDEVVRIMQADETASQTMVAMGGERSSVHRLQRSNFKSQQPTDSPTQKSKFNALSCTHCGRKGHTHQDPRCQIKGKQCRKCGKANHFDKVRRS